MPRILIIGNSGAGKSTLARRLGETLGLPVIHLDVLFWKPGWEESEDAAFRGRIAEALSGAAWICDGNFASTFDLSMPLADTVIWVDQPRLKCLIRAMWRVVRYRDGSRPDMAPGCRETVDLAFYRYILTFDRNTRPRIETALRLHGAHLCRIRLTSDQQIADFQAQA